MSGLSVSLTTVYTKHLPLQPSLSPLDIVAHNILVG